MPHRLPWYIAGPLVGLIVPAPLLVGNKSFGVSSNMHGIIASAIVVAAVSTAIVSALARAWTCGYLCPRPPH